MRRKDVSKRRTLLSPRRLRFSRTTMMGAAEDGVVDASNASGGAAAVAGFRVALDTLFATAYGERDIMLGVHKVYVSQKKRNGMRDAEVEGGLRTNNSRPFSDKEHQVAKRAVSLVLPVTSSSTAGPSSVVVVDVEEMARSMGGRRGLVRLPMARRASAVRSASPCACPRSCPSSSPSTGALPPLPPLSGLKSPTIRAPSPFAVRHPHPRAHRPARLSPATPHYAAYALLLSPSLVPSYFFSPSSTTNTTSSTSSLSALSPRARWFSAEAQGVPADIDEGDWEECDIAYDYDNVPLLRVVVLLLHRWRAGLAPARLAAACHARCIAASPRSRSPTPCTPAARPTDTNNATPQSQPQPQTPALRSR
ncbi:hypothetical protein B0H11DRAFT_2251868 [Mycena galericulata]|nr:hypothetical protein B0H11DRAFT_2251868 [Mycena galericulata]